MRKANFLHYLTGKAEQKNYYRHFVQQPEIRGRARSESINNLWYDDRRIKTLTKTSLA